MADFRIKQYVVAVNGYIDHTYYAASPGRARAQAWRLYQCADPNCTFRDFLRRSAARRSHDQTPPRFGEAIMVAGAPAYWIRSDGHYVWFVRPGQETILLSHPNDVEAA